MGTDAVANKLAEHGVLGILLALSLYFIYRLYTAQDEAHRARAAEAKASEQARVEEAKAYAAQTLELTRTAIAAITSSTAAAAASKEALVELRDLIRERMEYPSSPGPPAGGAPSGGRGGG